MKARFGLLALTSITALVAAGPVPQPGSVTTKDGARTFLLLRPATKGPLPLVILLHGHGGSAEQALTRGPLAAWSDISAREGVLVAALDGVKGPDGKRGWNDCRAESPGKPAVDDVAFAGAVARQLVAEAHADPARIYLMGMSNGAMMALRLALQMDPAPAAFCAVCGLMAEGGPCASTTARPIPALLIDGTADPLVPYGGGQVRFLKTERGAVRSAEQTVAFWRAADGLAASKAMETALPHREASDPTRAFKSVWGSAAGQQVVFIRIEGGGHAEPTVAHAYGPLYRAFTGKQNRDFESAEEAWAFFQAKRLRPAPVAAGSRD